MVPTESPDAAMISNRTGATRLHEGGRLARLGGDYNDVTSQPIALPNCRQYIGPARYLGAHAVPNERRKLI